MRPESVQPPRKQHLGVCNESPCASLMKDREKEEKRKVEEKDKKEWTMIAYRPHTLIHNSTMSYHLMIYFPTSSGVSEQGSKDRVSKRARNERSANTLAMRAARSK